MNEELNQRVSALEEARKSGIPGQKAGHKSLNQGQHLDENLFVIFNESLIFFFGILIYSVEHSGETSGGSGPSQKPAADEGGVYIDSDEEEMIESGQSSMMLNYTYIPQITFVI